MPRYETLVLGRLGLYRKANLFDHPTKVIFFHYICEMKFLPHIVAIAAFWVVSFFYFLPQFGGETLSQTDVQMYEGMKRDISEHRAEFDEDPQWTGRMFGGMPAYLISVHYPSMFLRDGVQRVLGFMGEPAALMFLAMVGFWLGLLMCGVNAWVAIFAALAYGLSTYNILIIEAGHITKMRAMGYAPMVVGAVVMAFRQTRPWLGGALAALFAALLIGAGHHQVTYYFGLVVVALWLGHFSLSRKFLITTGVLVCAAVLAVGANFTHLWYTFEHSPETIRAGSEVAERDGGGIDLEYATQWSYGVGESVNMFIADARGGSSMGGFSTNGEVADALRDEGYDPRLAEQLGSYWGDQPFTGGPTYLGAVVVFLAIFAFAVLPGRQKWWVAGVSVLGLLLAWGHNAMWFTRGAFVVLPGLDKFRTVSMALVILQWSVPFLAAMGVWKVLAGDVERSRVMRGLKWSVGIVGGVALFFALFGGLIFDFSSPVDGRYWPELTEAMRAERARMLTGDAWRSLLFVLFTAGILFFSNFSARPTPLRAGPTASQKPKIWLFALALSVLVLLDLVPVDRRFVDGDDFRPRADVRVKPDGVDRMIMADEELGFRVFNTANPFNEAYTSYFHRSVGGYHGAKLRRYQDVIDRYLVEGDLGILNLLNTKYFIFTDTDPDTGERTVELNPDANGAAWFVEQVIEVRDAREELDMLGRIDNKRQAVAELSDNIFRPDPAPPTGRADSLAEAEIELVEYRPNYLKYRSSSAGEGVVVFSEIYYDRGWTAYVDGVETPCFRADYILRAMVVPAGEHTIEWRFRAPRFRMVEAVTLVSNIAILISIILALWLSKTKGRNAA